MKQANLTKLVNAVKLCTETGKTTELREAYGTHRLKKKVFFWVLLPEKGGLPGENTESPVKQLELTNFHPFA